MTTSTMTPAAGMTRLPAAGTKRPVPPHGTPARYQGNRTGTRPPCKCPLCVKAHSVACQRRELAHLTGCPPRVPTGPVADHVHSLIAAGMSLTQISIAAEVSRSLVCNIAAERNPMCHRTKADKILAVRPRIVRDTDRLPAIGTRRRLQALYAMGHGSSAICALTGITAGAVQNLVYERTSHVTASTYKAVRAAYRKLAAVPGTSFRARASAQSGGWVTPAAWDDNIDDPSASPVAPAEEVLTRNELGALRRREIEHLASYGYEAETISERLDMGLSTVRAIVQELRTGERRNRRREVAA